MELYIFDKSLNFKGVFESYTSYRFVRRYYKAGEFELHCGLTDEALALLTRDSIIYKKDDPEAGYIEYRQLTQDATGKEVLVLKGRFLTGYLNRRIIWGTSILNTTAEAAMRTLVTQQCISPTDNARIIPNLMLGTLKGYTDTVDYQTSYASLGDELESLSNISNIGHRIKFDRANSKLVFETYKGLDRSVSQSINPRCVFSKEFDNVLEQNYTDSSNNYKNVCLVAGVGEGTARKLVTVGTGSGLDRLEVFNDQKGLSNVVDNVNLSDADYNKLLTEKGREKLAERADVKTFDSKINLNSNVTYKTDFDLGDIVTCMSKKWGITIDARITEIEEVYERGKPSINITFGNNVPTIIDKIKQLIK